MFIVCFKLAFTYIGNEVIIAKYNDGDYKTDTDVLLIANLIQPYIAHYNMGNIHYQNGKYEEAIKEYKEALSLEPGKDDECDVRINLALAIIKTLPEEYNAPENVESSINILKDAKEVLIEDGCAAQNGDGHNETAQKLKEEIDKMLEELSNNTSEPNGGGGQDKPDDDDDDDDDDNKRENKIQERLREEQNDAYKQRIDGINSGREFEGDSNTDLFGYVW